MYFTLYPFVLQYRGNNLDFFVKEISSEIMELSLEYRLPSYNGVIDFMHY